MSGWNTQNTARLGGYRLDRLIACAACKGVGISRIYNNSKALIAAFRQSGQLALTIEDRCGARGGSGKDTCH
jgi:hypothetical protein